MSAPSAEEQVSFLTHLQRLLSEGHFVATYKYALLLALADLAVEMGDDTDEPLRVPTARIAEKFIHYYWRQTAPFAVRNQTSSSVLRQNTGKQAAVLSKLILLRDEMQGNLTDLRSNGPVWRGIVREVRQVVVQMPLWKLQTVGRQSLQFLYDRSDGSSWVELKRGVAYCLRRFHALVVDLVQAAWTRYVRRLNPGVLEGSLDLDEFLFGTVRANLGAAQPVLRDLQRGRCFYCNGDLRAGQSQVDHFIPWSLYPSDIGHNFVLAHQNCNGSKADRLAAEDHLAVWVERNRRQGDELAAALQLRSVVCDLGVTKQIALWAYGLTESSGGQVWRRGDELERLSSAWRGLLM